MRMRVEPVVDSPSTVAQSAVADTPTAAWTGIAPVGPAPLVPGYEILGELGRGGMGIVYKARQIAVHRIVALKTVLDGDRASPEFTARFRAEAEAAARLQHPNIVQLYEFGEVDSRPYFSLEFVDGGSLADRLRGTPQPFDSAAKLIATAAEAMHYAHGLGVVHRDLKPANILLSSAGLVPKIADFGLAKRLDSMHVQTTTGTILGTPSYMSPEQAAGHTNTVGPAADIYALGAILYECLTGRPPFRGATALETVLQVARDQPVAPRQLRPEVPRDLEIICLRCLAKEPARRYLSARALADDLQRFLAREPIAARPASTWERTRLWARRHPARAVLYTSIFGGAVLLAAVGVRYNVVLSAAYQQIQSENRKARQQLIRLTLANGSRLADDGDYLSSLPWYVEALRLEDDRQRAAIHRQRIAAMLRLCPNLLQVWAHEAPVTDALIQGNERVAAASCDDGSIRLLNLDQPAEPARTLRSAQSGPRYRTKSPSRRPLSFDSTGRWLIAHLNDAVVCIDIRENSTPPIQLGANRAMAVWLQLDRMLICEGHDLNLWDAGARQLAGPEFSFDGPEITSIAVDPNGERFATGHLNGEIRVWDPTGWKSANIAMTLPGSVVNLQFRSDGRRLLAAGGAVARVWDVVHQRVATPAMHHAQTITDATFSPDGSTIATSSIDDTARLWNAELGQPFGDPLKHGSDVFHVTFSADSRLLATCSDDNTARVWNVRTGSLHVPPLPHSGTASAASFALDGRTLITASEDGTVKLWKIKPPEDGPAPEPPNFRLPRRIPIGTDGRYELVSSDEKLFSGSDGEYRVFDSRDKRWIVPGIVHPGGILALDVNPAGTVIATAGYDRTARLWDWHTGSEIAVPMAHGSRVVEVVFSPDGCLVATASEDNSARVWDAVTCGPVTPFLWHVGAVRHIRFSPDSRFVLTAGKNDMAFLWEVATGEEIAPARVRESWVGAALASRHAAVRWDFAPDERPVEELMRLAQWLSGHRVDTGGLAPLTVEEYQRLAPGMRQVTSGSVRTGP
jgi:serine/threonine protein kinase/WD40 repeat protein